MIYKKRDKGGDNPAVKNIDPILSLFWFYLVAWVARINKSKRNVFSLRKVICEYRRCVHISFHFRLSENIWNKEICVEQRRGY